MATHRSGFGQERQGFRRESCDHVGRTPVVISNCMCVMTLPTHPSIQWRTWCEPVEVLVPVDHFFGARRAI